MLIIALIVFNVQYHFFFLLHSVNLFLAFGVVLISSLAAALLVLSEVMPEFFTDDCEVLESPSSSILFPSAWKLSCSWGLSEVIKDDFKDEAASLKLLWKLISCEVQGGDSEMFKRQECQPIRGQQTYHVIWPDQLEASVQITWPSLTNQRPASSSWANHRPVILVSHLWWLHVVAGEPGLCLWRLALCFRIRASFLDLMLRKHSSSDPLLSEVWAASSV